MSFFFLAHPVFCHSSAQELFILLDVRLTMSTVVMGWTMINFE